MGFGIREPTIVGMIGLRLPATPDIAALDRRMAEEIDEAPPADAGDPDSLRLARRIAFYTCALQRRAQVPVFGMPFIDGPHPRDGADFFRLALPCYAIPAVAEALAWVAAAICSLLAAAELHERTAERICATLKGHAPRGINTYRLLATADELGIPVRRLVSGVFAFGLGARARWLESTFTDQTGVIGARIAGDKFLTANLLRAAGLAAATHELARSPQEAVAIARRLGYPVVVKPADRQQGKGVAANLGSDDAVALAFAEAAKLSKNILVEKHFDGTELRVTVLCGKTFRIAARSAGGVTGDGVSSIAELVARQQQSPLQRRRRRERGHVLIELDAEAAELLAEAGLSPQSVLAEGRFQRLRRRANVSAGGMLTNVAIADVHPDNVDLAERAVRLLRLDLGGVDVILPDLSRSWLETGALICEVNAQPQIGRSHIPDLLTQLLQGDGRIPLLLIIGSGEGFDREAALATMPGLGLASVDGLWLGARRLARPLPDGFAAGEMLVGLPEVEAAIVILSPAEVARSGLPVDRCDLLVLQGPDDWDSKSRDALPDILDLVLPHTLHAVCLPPGDLPRAAGSEARRLEPAGAESLQQIVDRFVTAARQSAASRAPSSADSPLRSTPPLAGQTPSIG